MLTHDPKRPKYKGPFSIEYKERGSHARGVYDVSHTVYLAHGNSKGEARGRNKRKNNARVARNLEERKESGHEGEKSQTKPNYR